MNSLVQNFPRRLGFPAISNRYWLLFAGLLLLSFFTLNISPLPWYDEIDFSSITQGYINNKTFTCTANDLYFPVKGPEVLYYGPVYFVLNSAIVKWLGFGIAQFRVLNFFSGIACIFLFIKLFGRLSGKTYTAENRAVFALLMLSDYTWTQDMHSGRMDLLALMFVLTGLLFADPAARKTWLNFFLSGFFIAIALLTTPRIYFIVLPYYLYLLYTYFVTREKRILVAIICAGCTTSAFYLFWVLFKFGSVREFIDYLHLPSTGSAGDFFTPNLPIPPHQVIYYGLLLLMLLFAGLKKYKMLAVPENSISLATILLFVALAGGSDIYMCLITGFMYILIMNLAGTMANGKNLALALLLIINFGLAGYKYFIVLRDYKGRSAAGLDKWMKKMILPGSKVVADDKYYYAVIKAGSEFQYYSRGENDNERIAYQNNKWKADYLLVSDTTDALFGKYRNNANLLLLNEYNPYAGRASSQPLTSSYQGLLFKFLR